MSDSLSSPIIVYDRSRTTTDWSCERKRYWQYEYAGRGIVPDNTALELYMGSAIHDGLAAIAQGVDIDEIAGAAHTQMMNTLLANVSGETEPEAVTFAHEQAALVAGLLLGFNKHVWPRLMKAYPKVVAVEQEMQYEHNGLVFMSRPDLVVADPEGNLWYIEYKSTSSKRDSWINSWSTAVQLHSTIKAIEATLGQQPLGVIVQGLYKGYESYGKQSSPMCYAYKRFGTPPFSADQISYEYKPGFKRYPTWELEGGVKGWVDSMPEDILATQFPQTPPIFIREGLISSFFEQREGREMEIKLAMRAMEGANEVGKQGVMDIAFTQNFQECHPAWGKPCPYRNLCHGHVEDPLSQGYILREAHHVLEAKIHNEITQQD